VDRYGRRQQAPLYLPDGSSPYRPPSWQPTAAAAAAKNSNGSKGIGGGGGAAVAISDSKRELNKMHWKGIHQPREDGENIPFEYYSKRAGKKKKKKKATTAAAAASKSKKAGDGGKDNDEEGVEEVPKLLPVLVEVEAGAHPLELALPLTRQLGKISSLKGCSAK
jgi:hypothetical protein